MTMNHLKLRYLFTLTLTILLCLPTLLLAQNNGKIAGKITDKKTGEELIGVSVQVEGTNIGTATDFEGKYMLSLAPGTYNLVVSYISYNKKTIKGIEVKAKETNVLNVLMEESTKELNEVVIQVEAKKESANAVLIQQKNAVAVSSGVSADLIRKTPDRTTADVVKRISGASIQDNKFAIVRGLGDRYNTAFINGAPLPSSESDRKAFSLDLIPAAVLDNMLIQKTATPDMPGDFAGGFIQINTKDIPEENGVTIGISGGMHSLTTFKQGFTSQATGKNEWLGFDNNARIMPSGAMTTEQNKNATTPELIDQTKLFNNNFEPTRISSMNPNMGFNISASRRFKTDKNEFGVIALLNYSNNNRYRPMSINEPVIGSNQEEVDLKRTDGKYYSVDEYKNTVSTTGIINLSAKLGKNNKLSFKNMITQTGENTTFLRQGDAYFRRDTIFQLQENRKFNDYLYMYQQSRMYAGQLSGEHFITSAKVKVKYTLGYSDIKREMPDYKRLIYQADKLSNDTVYGKFLVQLNPDANAFTPNQSGRFFSELHETSPSAKYEASIPLKLFKKTELHAGGFHQFRNRTFNGRNFLLTYDNNNFDFSKHDSIGALNPGQVFDPSHIAPDLYFQRETTQGSDSYTASSTLHAGFLMMDNKIINRVRLIWGARYEVFNQKLNSEAQGRKVEVNKTIGDLLPSANLIIELTEKQNLRVGYARTLSRPEFREFAPLAFYEPMYNAIITGNDSLSRAVIDNIDVKWEFYPTAAQTISINPFYKRFDNPVEMVIVPNPSFRSYSYQNAYSAINYGIELEFRIQLAEIDKILKTNLLKNFTLFSNLAFINSEVKLRNAGSGVSKRPLQGQSPYVFNIGLNYANPKWFDVALNYNRVGRRIAFVGNEDQQIIWENPRSVMDLSISRTFFKKLQAKITIGDIFAQDLIFYQDMNKNGQYDEGKDIDSYHYQNGRTTSVSLSYTF